MKKSEIAKRMARDTGVTRAEAADRLDAVVRQVLADLRRRRESEFPGLGRLRQGPHGQLSFEPEAGGRDE